MPADQPGIAALRYDGGAGLVSQFQDGADFACTAWLQYQRRTAGELAARFLQVRGNISFACQRVFRAGNGGEFFDEIRCQHGRTIVWTPGAVQSREKLDRGI